MFCLEKKLVMNSGEIIRRVRAELPETRTGTLMKREEGTEGKELPSLPLSVPLSLPTSFPAKSEQTTSGQFYHGEHGERQ
jgi:hypothetical protein